MNNIHTNTQIISIPQTQVHMLCRICLEQSTTIQSQKLFISPCRCKGTSQYVHYQCLKNWIKKSLWKHTKDKQGTYTQCQMCKSNIYFTIGSESWISWYKNKPCSAVFYLSWILLLLISFIAVVFLVIYALVTKQYAILRFLGLPLGFFLFGGFVFLQCGKDFRDFQTGIVQFKEKYKNQRKTSTDTVKGINAHQSNM